MNKSANKTLISMKANDKNNKVQTGATFTQPENEKLLLKKKENGVEDSCVINLVGPRLLPTSSNFENMACEKSKMKSKGHPTLKVKLKKKSSCIFPIDNNNASKSVDKEVSSSPPLSAQFNKATKISSPPKSFLKHFIRKKTYFNNVWTALFNFETFGACSFKAQEKHYQGHHSFKSLFTKENSDLLEVSSSLVQATSCNTRRGTFNSLEKCEQNTSKVQYGIANPEEGGSLENQDSDVESVPSVIVRN